MPKYLTFFVVSLPEELAVLFLALAIAGVRAESRLLRFFLSGLVLAIAFYAAWLYVLPLGFAVEILAQTLFFALLLRLAWAQRFAAALVIGSVIMTYILAIQTVAIALLPLFGPELMTVHADLARFLAAWVEIALLLLLALMFRTRPGFALSRASASTAPVSGAGALGSAAMAGQIILVAVLLAVTLSLVLAIRQGRPLEESSAAYLAGLSGLAAAVGASSVISYRLVKRSAEEGTESQRRLADLVSRLPGIVYRRRAGDDLLIEYAWAAGLGAEGMALIGGSWRDLIDPQDEARVVAALNEARARRSEYSIEYRLRSEGEARRWVWDRGGVLEDSDGGLVEEGYAADITERKRAEEGLEASRRENEVLLRELAHRTGNSLQTIASLVRLRAVGLKDPGAEALLSDIALRIDALALVQAALRASSDLSLIRLDAYLEDLVSSLAQRIPRGSARIMSRLELAPCSISIDAAGTLGLVLAELILNAGSHAAGGRDRCELRISLGVEASGWIRLELEDDGPGLPEDLEPARLETLGLPLILGLTRDQLCGEAAFSRGPRLRWTLRFPPHTERRI